MNLIQLETCGNNLGEIIMWVSNSSVEILEDEWIVPYYKTIIDMKKSISNSNLKYVRLKKLVIFQVGVR